MCGLNSGAELGVFHPVHFTPITDFVYINIQHQFMTTVKPV
jgi:hypothetical protein